MIKFDRIDEIKSKTNFGFMTEDPWLILAKINDLSQRLFDTETADLAFTEFKSGLLQLKDEDLIEPFRSVASYYLNSTHVHSVASIFKLIHQVYFNHPEVFKTKKKRQMCELGFELMELYVEFNIPIEEYMTEFNEFFEFFVEFITSKNRKSYTDFEDYKIVREQFEEKKEELKTHPEYAMNFVREPSLTDISLDKFAALKSDNSF